jgi:hypothetical protein
MNTRAPITTREWAKCLPRRVVQALGKFTYAPDEPVRGRAGPLVCLPGRLPVPPGLGALFAGRVEGKDVGPGLSHEGAR